MKKKVFMLCICILTLILEILPNGVVLSFSNPNGEPWRRFYSYFDLTPFGLALFGPLITAILTCVLFVLCVVFPFKSTLLLGKAIKLLAGIAFAISLTPLLYGIEFFTVIGAFISVLLLVLFVLSFVVIRKFKSGI